MAPRGAYTRLFQALQPVSGGFLAFLDPSQAPLAMGRSPLSYLFSVGFRVLGVLRRLWGFGLLGLGEEARIA